MSRTIEAIMRHMTLPSNEFTNQRNGTEKLEKEIAVRKRVCAEGPLFSPLSVRSVTFRNRIGLSPLAQASAEDEMSNDRSLFSPVQVGPYELRNRLVMAPMTRNRAGRGNVPQPMSAPRLVSSLPRLRRSPRRAWVIQTPQASTIPSRCRAGDR
jgi:hypothetical protein